MQSWKKIALLLLLSTQLSSPVLAQSKSYQSTQVNITQNSQTADQSFQQAYIKAKYALLNQVANELKNVSQVKGSGLSFSQLKALVLASSQFQVLGKSSVVHQGKMASQAQVQLNLDVTQLSNNLKQTLENKLDLTPYLNVLKKEEPANTTQPPSAEQTPSAHKPPQSSISRADLDNAIKWQQKSSEALLKKEYQKALVNVNNALKFHPNFVTAHRQKATIYSVMKKYPEALASYDKALSIDPNDVFTILAKARTLSRMKYYTQANELFHKARQLDPYNADIDASMALNYQNQGLTEQAIAAYTEAIRKEPRDDISYMNRAFNYIETKRYEAALNDYNTALAIFKEQNRQPYPFLYSARGQLYLLMDKEDQAFDDYLKAYELGHQDHYIHDDLSQLYFKRNQLNKASFHINKAIESKPNNGNYYLLRGQIHQALGFCLKANNDYKKACELGEAKSCTRRCQEN